MKVAIAGFGLEGEENYAYWSADPSNEITIVDEDIETKRPLPAGAATMLGPGAFEKLDDYDLVIRTAGLAPYKIKTKGKVWSATNEFLAKCPAPVIGITGSKGKGTTASLATSILRAAGKTVWLVGNIGVPALSVLPKIAPDDIVVYELSSFQAWDLQHSPHVAVVLYIEQEHLDVHTSMEDYVDAKAHITKHQTADDILVYNGLNAYAQQIAATSKAQKIAYPSPEAAHVKDNYFYYGKTKICPVSILQLKGKHNIDNAMAAIDAVWSYTQNTVAIERGLGSFKGLPHRLAYVATINGVDYYDDSIATTPSSAIAALRAFPGSSKVIILGGSYKGSDFTALAEELSYHQATKALLIGDEAVRIAKACNAVGFRNYEVMEQATAEGFTRRASELASPGDIVLLSPAAASFGLFRNYVDRGEQYIAAVRQLQLKNETTRG